MNAARISKHKAHIHTAAEPPAPAARCCFMCIGPRPTLAGRIFLCPHPSEDNMAHLFLWTIL